MASPRQVMELLAGRTGAVSALPGVQGKGTVSYWSLSPSPGSRFERSKLS